MPPRRKLTVRLADLVTRDRERERWSGFRDARLRQRVLEWLTEEGIEPRLEAG
jgi:hypothetical protein